MMSNERDCDDQSDKSGPLSLQDQSFIYILAHLKDYPVDMLALLPKSWRTKLLRAAPPLQLYMLESSPISEGIDTDVFWQEMSCLKDSVWVNYVVSESESSHDRSHGLQIGSHDHDGGSQVPLKARFVNYICHMLLNESNRLYAITRISEFLLAVHKDRLDSDVVIKMTTTHIPTQLLFSPPYYFIPFRCPRYTEQQIVSLLISAGALPTTLEINEEQFIRTRLWQSPMKDETNKLFESLFENLKFLRFHSTRFYSKPLNLIMTSFYKHEQISTSSQMSPAQNNRLESLEFHSMCRESVTCVADHFSKAKGFKHLKKLDLRLVETAAPLGNKIAGMVNNQLQSLECLYLSNLVSNQYASSIQFDEYQLFSSLASLISKPQFRQLTLERFQNLPQALVEKILLAFFATEPEHKQTLCIRNSTIKKSGSVPFQIKNKDKDLNDKSKLATSIACTLHKNVSFENVTLPNNFFTWFEKVGSIYLHSLKFNGITVVPDVPSRHTHGSAQSEERYVSDTRRVYRARYVDQDEKKAKLPESKDPRLVFYTHPGFRCINFSWSQLEV